MVQPAARAAPAFRKIMLQLLATDLRDGRCHLRNREVPRDESSGHTNRLLHSEDSSSRSRRCLNCSRNSLCLSGEPPSEAQSIVKLSLRFSEWLSSLIGDKMSNVISVFPDQCIPFQEPLSSSAWVDLSVSLECFMSCYDCSIDVFGCAVWSRGPDFSVSGIWRGMRICSETGVMEAMPTTSNLLPDLASTHSPLTSDLSLKREGFLTWTLSARSP
jgi:hypothetical protein